MWFRLHDISLLRVIYKQMVLTLKYLLDRGWWLTAILPEFQ